MLLRTEVEEGLLAFGALQALVAARDSTQHPLEQRSDRVLPLGRHRSLLALCQLILDIEHGGEQRAECFVRVLLAAALEQTVDATQRHTNAQWTQLSATDKQRRVINQQRCIWGGGCTRVHPPGRGLHTLSPGVPPIQILHPPP